MHKRSMLLKQTYAVRVLRSTKLQNAPGATSRHNLSLKTCHYRSWMMQLRVFQQHRSFSQWTLSRSYALTDLSFVI